MGKNEQIAVAFTSHVMDASQSDRATNIRTLAKDVALLIEHTCIDSREKSLAMTKLEEAVFWAVAGIAREGA